MQDIRWKQRFSGYTNILKLLADSLKGKNLCEFSELEQIGLAKSFELCFELLWNLLKDYLEEENIEIGLLSPKNILKVAASKGLLDDMGVDGDVLMQAHKSRNELVHIYDHEKFVSALEEVNEKYLPQLIKVEIYFKERMNYAE